MRTIWWPGLLMTLFTLTAAFAADPPRNEAKAPAVSEARTAVQSEENMRVEGEQRFRTNCGRCHQAPHKFPPRMIATIERHMRVRALVTEEDMRLILHYLTQ